VAGISAALDVEKPNGAYGREVASSAAGSIAARSGESISLLGNIEAAAGSGGTSGRAAAGSLDVELTRSEPWWSPPTGTAAPASFNQGPLTVELLPTVPSTVLPLSSFSNQAWLGAAQLSQSGLDALRLESGNDVEFSSGVSLSLGRQLVIDAPVIAANTGANANLSAPYVEIGYDLVNITPKNTYAALGGTGTLSFSGSEIDLVGTTVFQGASAVRLTSSGDLLLRGQALGAGADTLVGGVTVVGDLTLDAARIYPVTATNFAIDAQEDPSTGIPGIVTIGQTGSNPGTPLSAGGALSISAYTVTSTGTLYAPFGTISLDATHGLTLGDGSLTSVSGDGLVIPYGETQYGGAQWIYGAFSGNQTISAVPARAVSLTAPAITLSKQATIDLSGGGDLSAFEWVPGPGGSTDALAPGASPGLYAILPSTRGGPAPQDPQNNDSSIGAAQSVYLSGGAGLAAGTYPLLPARYALEPGAFLIEVEPQFQGTSPGALGALANGTPVVAGFLSYGSTGLHQLSGYTGFAIYPGSYGSELAAYDVSLASSFFSAAATAGGAPRPTLPADAGSLSIAVGDSLEVAGQVLTKAASGGLAAPIDISANDLVIGTPSGSVPSDAVFISGSVLSGWQPGSLVLGGTMTSDLAGTATPTATASAIDVVANTVTVGSGTTLTAGQIVIVANQSIDVQNGASLQSTSAATSIAPALPPTLQSVTLSGSNGAGAGFLAVSDLNWLIPLRTGGTSAAGAATVAIDAGGSIASRGSLSIDGIGGVTLNGTVAGPGAEWSLGSSSIAFAPAGASTDAMSIGSGLLAQLGAAGAVRLASTGSIDLLMPVSLGVGASGTPTLTSLTLEASSLNNLTGADGNAGATTTRLGAHTLVLEGSGATAPTAVAGPAGATLSLTAGELDVGPNALAVNGFEETRAAVSGAVVGEGSGGLSVGGDLAIAAGGVTAAAAAVTTLSATGALSVARAAPGSAGKVPLLLGGTLTLSGSSVDISGTVSAPSGGVTLAATNNLTVDSGATISTAGTVVSIGNQSAGTPGGSMAITTGGNLTLSPGATLDVSGAGTADAGSLSLVAGGSASIGSTLHGSGGAGATGGSFSLDASALAASSAGANPLTALANALGTGGFSDAIDLRVRTGNLDLDAGSTLSANAVTLTADAGQVVIGGDISAPSAALRGSLSIFGGDGVELNAGAALHSDGAGPSGLGGTIEIGAGQLVADQTGTLDAYNNGSISLDAGSTISTAGAAGEGFLLLRAPALLASGDVAIATLASNTSGVGQIIVEPVLPFNTATFSSSTAPTATDFQNVNQTVGNYMAAAQPNILTRLAPGGATPLLVEAGVEIIAPGALTLQSADGVSPALDLSSWRFSGEPIDLTVRAAGNLTVANTLTDGFGSATIGGVSQPILLAGPSSSIRLVAGADVSSANPLAVMSAGAGDLTIGTPNQSAVVRTGTGSIDLIAANNILIEGDGSGAYTAGTPAVAPGGNAANPYAGIPKSLGTEKCTPACNAPGSYGYGVQIPQSSLLMSFPTGGGALVVRAGEDITTITPGLPATSAGGVPDWQLREGGTTYQPATSTSPLAIPVEWGVDLAAYNWTFGTLGGGDLNIAAGRDALNVSAAAADSLLPPEGGATQYVTGGGLSFTAGRNIGSAQVFLADGTGTVAAGGALTAILPPGSGAGPDVGSAFYLQSSSINVNARQGMAVDGILDPTGLDQPNPTLSTALIGDFLSLSANSALNLEAVAGDINLGESSAGTQTLLGLNLAGGAGADVVPASLSVQALGGNISLGTGIGAGGMLALYPSQTGQLNLLAAQNIVADSSDRLIMSDAAPGSYATVANPLGKNTVDSLPAQFGGDLHGSDTSPALVTAGGSIEELSLSIPKAAQVVAGQDIVDLTYSGQNLNATDQTVIAAGRDITYSEGLNGMAAYGGSGISVGGPGTLDILAGRNVSLGFSQGVQTTGNLVNANLPTAQGAGLTIATGLGTKPDFADFLTKIIAPSTAYQAELISYVESLQGSSGLSFADAETAFKGFTPDQQRPLIDDVFFNELSLSGLADNTVPGAGFTEGYAAIDTLFPGSRTGTAGAVAGAYGGDLTLSFSKIYTDSGGDINLIVPGGLINVGLANPPSSFSARSPSTLGIVAEGPGNVDIYSRGDVNVNSSRIFTLGGGNILIWSDEGSIDAGLGAKTSVSAPPPAILINSNGTVSLDFSGAATGSGIRTIQTQPDTPAGNVDLIAPVGTVNAGDAGIGAAGNINIAALSVIGVSNIQFGGTATGVPAQVSNIGASLSGASSAASGATNTATSAVQASTADKEAAAPLAQTALTWLDVFVTGLGEENCKPDDIECLKRQKTPTR
jgi:filamentous hemagglutinin